MLCIQHPILINRCFRETMQILVLFSILLLLQPCNAFVGTGFSRNKSTIQRNRDTSLANFLTDIGDMLTGGKLGEENNLPFEPLCPVNSISSEPRCFAVKERAISFTGEDFDIYCTTAGEPFARVRGAMLHLPGKDKMRLRSTMGCDDEVCVLDRVLLSYKQAYDIYRGGMGAEKVAWIEKELVALSDTFDVYLEGSGVGPFKKAPIYKITGDFIDRNFVMRNEEGVIVAKVQKDGIVQFDAFNHYQVQVAPGMDAMLVLACTCAIDEEFDEEHAKKRAERAEE